MNIDWRDFFVAWIVSTIVFFAVLALPSDCKAADAWSTTDKALATAFVAGSIADWRQTRDIANHPDIHEVNPFLGDHPSNSRIDTFFVASRLITLGAAHFLPGKYRTPFLTGAVAIQVGYVANNAHLGLKVGF